jgi:hypothetical protein
MRLAIIEFASLSEYKRRAISANFAKDATSYCVFHETALQPIDALSQVWQP